MSFEQGHIDDVQQDVVKATPQTVDDLILALELAPIDSALLQEAENFDGAQEEGRPSPGSGSNSITIDHNRTAQAVTYIDGHRYNAKNPLPSYDVNSKNAYQLAYNVYQQSEHNKPFCILINLIINTRNPYFANAADTSIDFTERASREFIEQQKFKPDSLSVSHIYKKIGEKYYYISVESDIKIFKDAQKTVPFDIVTIYEIRQKSHSNGCEFEAYELHREGMYVQKAYKELVKSHICSLLNLDLATIPDSKDEVEQENKANFIKAINEGKGILLAEMDLCPEYLRDILNKLPVVSTAHDLAYLKYINNIIIFLKIQLDIVQKKPLPADLHQKYINFICAIQQVKQEIALNISDDFENTFWLEIEKSIISLGHHLLSQKDGLLSVRTSLFALHLRKDNDEKKNTCYLMVFLSWVKYILDKDRQSLTKLDIKEFLQSAAHLTLAAPYLKTQVDAIKLVLLPELKAQEESQKKSQKDWVSVGERIKLEMIYNIKNPIQRLQELGYQQLVCDSLQVQNPDHVRAQRATTLWHGKKTVEQPPSDCVIANAITYDYAIKTRNLLLKLICRAEFDCIFDDDENTEHFVIIEKNIKVEDSTVDPEYPLKSYVPFHVIGVYQKDGTLIARYVHKNNLNLAQQMIDNLGTAANQLPLDMDVYAHQSNNQTFEISLRKEYSLKLEELRLYSSSACILFEQIEYIQYLKYEHFIVLIDIINTILTHSVSESFILDAESKLGSITGELTSKKKTEKLKSQIKENWSLIFQKIILFLRENLHLKTRDMISLSKLDNELKNILGDLDLSKLTVADYRLVEKIINTDPKKYNELIMQAIRSGLGEKTKIKYDKTAYNPLLSAMLVMSGLSVAGFVFVACAPLFASSVAILALEYCIAGIIAGSITGVASHNCLKMWSPLYDVMKNVKTAAKETNEPSKKNTDNLKNK